MLRRSTLSAPSVDSRALVLADFDGDGDQDVFVATFRSRNLLFVNDGRGKLLDASSGLPASPDGAMAAVAGDLDGDGDLDLAVARGDLTGGDLLTVLLRNDGRGHFTLDSGAFPAMPAITSQLLAFDADGDGDLDLLAVRQGPGGVQPPEDLDKATRLLINDGRGTFAPSMALTPDARSVSAAAVADLDGDGSLDIALAPGPITDVVVTGPPLPWTILLGDGRGNYRDAGLGGMSAPISHGRTTAVVEGDLNGDRLPDLMAVELLSTGPSLVRFLNLRHAFARFELASSPPRALSMADVDGDGDRDVAAAGIGLLLGDGLGNLNPAPLAGLLPVRPTQTMWRDLDGTLKDELKKICSRLVSPDPEIQCAAA
ncbi:MAG: VCBS repeat-containing protein, partial [Planctomycetes bacterium]|nr:VCBS repeat-containing protein [Planctomycetota bacterium]